MQGPVLTKDGSEKALDAVDIIAKLPENSLCADCGEKGPRYVNGQYGVFICRPCAEVHKSLMDPGNVRSMDTGLRDFWPKKFSENLSKIGNKNAAQIWENTLQDEDPAVYRPSPKKSHFVVSWFSAQPIEHREEWIRSKYVGRFFVEPKKGFLMVQWRDKGTAPRPCFVQIRPKNVVIYDDEYPPKPTSLIEQHEGQTIALLPLTYQDVKKKKGPYFEVKTPRGTLRLEPRAPDTDTVLQEWHDALQQLQGRVTYLRNREIAVSSDRISPTGSSVANGSPGRGWVSTKPGSAPSNRPPGERDDDESGGSSSERARIASSTSGPLEKDVANAALTHSNPNIAPAPLAQPLTPRTAMTVVTSTSSHLHQLTSSASGSPVPTTRTMRGLTTPQGYNATVLASFAGQELLVLLHPPGIEAKPPMFAVFKHDSNVVVELALFHTKVALKQKGQVVSVVLKPTDNLRESVVCYPPAADTELMIIVPTHMQRDNVTEADGKLRVMLVEAEQEIAVVSVKSAAAK